MSRSTRDDDFEDPPPERGGDDGFVLRLEAYEGPIDVLLDQVREQIVDLSQISILALADQYLGFIERARTLRLELAADYLVMAAWLAYLKSRMLLPEDPDGDEPTGTELAEALAFQLRRLEAMREAGIRLMARPRLGSDWYARGAPEPMATTAHRGTLDVSLYELLKAYGDQRRRRQGDQALYIQASNLYSADQALRRLTEMLGRVPGWTTLSSFLPVGLTVSIVARSALAAMLTASLELAKAGKIVLRQDRAFDQIYLRRTEGWS